ncbi:MAG TPA: hypothetical protein VGD22_10715, partial [Sphingobacteriaceae bacterium]
LPLSRQEIVKHLAIIRDSASALNSIEKAELEFYEKEYSEFNPGNPDTTIFAKKDSYGRFGFLTARNNGFMGRAEPVAAFETRQGREKSILKSVKGLQFWGHAGKRWGFQAYFTEITESGNGIDTIKQFTNEPGIIRTANIKKDAKSLNYTNFRGSLTYNWNNGSVSIGHDNLLWGYGENGHMVLSDKAPAYPFIRLDYQPLKWLSFNYAHTWLHSGLIDSARTYAKGNSVYGNVREIYVQKYMATHSLNFFPIKGLALSIGESMVYSDRIEAGYLIPIMFFKAYDQYASRYKISTGSNGQFFFQASSRNHIPKTHLYANLFIDEIRVSEVFNKEKNRNQVGFNIGASVIDILIPYTTFGLEYTRINPFVYQNLVPAQNYTNQNYFLGDWIGQNADRVTAWIKYNPIPRLMTEVQLNYIRKGPDGNIEDQYYAEPQPKFLANPFNVQKQLMFDIKYEIIHQLRVYGSYQHQGGIIRPELQPKAVPNEFRFGVSYGF